MDDVAATFDFNGGALMCASVRPGDLTLAGASTRRSRMRSTLSASSRPASAASGPSATVAAGSERRQKSGAFRRDLLVLPSRLYASLSSLSCPVSISAGTGEAPIAPIAQLRRV